MSLISDELKVAGKFWFKVYGKDGGLKEEREIPNLMTTTGLASVAAMLLADVGLTGYDYIGIGTGTTAADVGDTAIEAEVGRVVTTGTVATTTGTDDTAQFVGQTTFGASFAITEAGVLNASSSGNLLCRQVFAAINVVNLDSIAYTYTLSISSEA